MSVLYRFLAQSSLLFTLLILCSCARTHPAAQPGEVSVRPTVTSTDPQEKKTLAVLDFESAGLSQYETAVFAGRFRSVLARSGPFHVIELGQLQAILAEQDFQMSGCVSNECAIEVGQLLGAQLMLVGAISKIGSTYNIDIRMIDVETGRITASVSLDFRGEFGLLLTKGVSEVVQLITGGSIPDLVETTSEPPVKLRTEVLNIAVVEFHEKGSLGIEDAGEIVAGWMNGSLHNTGVFILYERVLLQDVLAQQDIGLTGVMDESTTTEIGKLYGVEAIVTGTISKFANTFSIVARLIDTKTAKVIATADIKTKDIDAIAKATDGLAIELAKEP